MSDRNLRQEPTTVLAVLLTVRELLADPECWCKNAYIELGPKTRRCLLGGLQTATTHCPELYIKCIVILESALPKASFRGVGCLSLFNDTPGRKHPEIIDLLDKAISKAMQEGSNERTS